ncbi:hypothetical protein ACWDGI_40775 [Streptomyces sp. NPDC001220]
MSIPCLAQREDQQQLEWIGGSVFSVLLDAEATGGRCLTDVHADPMPTVVVAGRGRTRRGDALAPGVTDSTCTDRACFEFEAEVLSSTVTSNSKQCGPQRR